MTNNFEKDFNSKQLHLMKLLRIFKWKEQNKAKNLKCYVLWSIQKRNKFRKIKVHIIILQFNFQFPYPWSDTICKYLWTNERIYGDLVNNFKCLDLIYAINWKREQMLQKKSCETEIETIIIKLIILCCSLQSITAAKTSV